MYNVLRFFFRKNLILNSISFFSFLFFFLSDYNGQSQGVGVEINPPVSIFHTYENNTNTGTNTGITIEQDGTGDAAMQFLFSGGGGQRWVLGVDNSDADKFKLSGSTDLGSNSFFQLTTGGLFGVGTDHEPISLFHLYENNANEDGTVGLTIEQNGSGDAISQYLLTGGQRWVSGIDNSDGDKFKIASSTDLNSNALFTIQSTGEVGIGTTSPTAFLHTAPATASIASVRIEAGVIPTSPNTGDMYADGTNLFYYNGAGWDDITATGGTSYWARATGPGRIYPSTLTDQLGVGTNSPSSLVHFSSSTAGDAGLTIESDTDNNDENDNSFIEFLQDGGTNYGLLGLSNTGFDPKGVASSGALSNAFQFSSDNSIQFSNDAVVAMTIEDGTRDIGFGTTTPDGDLTIESGGSTQLFMRGDGNDYSASIRLCEGFNYRGGFMQYDAAGNDLIIGIHDADDTNTGTDVESIRVSRANGFVGIHTNSDAVEELDVRGTIIGAVPCVAIATTRDDYINGEDSDVMGIIVASVPSTNHIWVKVIQDANNGRMSGLEHETDWTNGAGGAWVDFEDPSNGGNGYVMDIDVSLETDGGEDDDDQFGAVIVVRWSDGTVYIKSSDINNERDNRLDDAGRWDNDGTNGWHSWNGPGM